MTVRKTRDLVIYCDRPSDTARELSKRLNARRLFGTSANRLRSLAGALVVNYGTGHNPTFNLGAKSVVLNKPEAVLRAISKRSSYEAFLSKSVPTLDFTRDKGVASAWLQEGSGVLCRRDGLSGGAGIVFVPKGSKSLPDADFYTKYFAKTHEYRAHVFSGRLIDLTQKRLQNGASKDANAPAETRIVRSLENGWVHAHGEIYTPGDVRSRIEKLAVDALGALGLDFGAVDVLAKFSDKHPNQPPVLVVCEVNTAPGLANEVTLKAYEKAILAHYESTRDARSVPVVPRRRRVRKLVKVWITTKKGNRVQRDRERWVYE